METKDKLTTLFCPHLNCLSKKYARIIIYVRVSNLKRSIFIDNKMYWKRRNWIAHKKHMQQFFFINVIVCRRGQMCGDQ